MLSVKNNKVKILDCTLRDGGYYTGWEFTEDLISDFFDTIDILPVSMVELGYAGKSEGSGYFASVSNAKIEQTAATLITETCVMIDAKDVLAIGSPLSAAVGELIERLEKGKITTVRVAAHYSTSAACEDICNELSRRGFRVFLNLMQIDAATDFELETCIAEVKRIKSLEVLYIADSFGSMTPMRVAELVERFRQHVCGEIGFHGHDNRGLALTNSMVAITAGATWIDSTMGGMGRGAGNTATEQLLPVIADLDSSREQSLLTHVLHHFVPLRQRHQWGSSAAYQFAGSNLIHPSFVQKLRDEGGLSEIKIIERLLELDTLDRRSFSIQKLRTLMVPVIS